MHPVDLQTTALAIISRNQQCHSSAAACSFSREQNTVSTCRALTSPASPACPNPHSVLRHHSPAALLSRYLLTRFRALALFGRRPGERVVSSRRRAAENLTRSGCEQSQQEPELFDHLVSKLLKMQRHIQAERFGGIEVDDEFEFGGLLDWEVGWLGALQNFIHIRGGAPANVLNARSVGYKAAASRNTRSS